MGSLRSFTDHGGWCFAPWLPGVLQGLHPPPAELKQVDKRLAVQLALVTLWGTRLTYNFWRKVPACPWANLA